MADITVEGSVSTSYPGSWKGGCSFMTVWTTKDICYQFYMTTDIFYRKSTDGGATWAAAVTIAANATEAPEAPSVWFDKWTSGNSGSLIHIAYLNVDNMDVMYLNVNTASADAQSTDVVAKNVTAFDADVAQSCTHIVRAEGGNLYIAWSTTNTTPLSGFERSVDVGANWTSRDNTAGIEADVDDLPCSVLLPGRYADTNDILMIYGDQSANAVTAKQYDNSANSWSESAAMGGTLVLGTAGTNQVTASYQHSDGLVVVAVNSHIDNAAGDLLVSTWDYANWSAKTNIITDKDDWAGVALCIDQNTDDWYVGWLGNPAGSDTWTATVTAFDTVSTDSGANWAAAAAYGVDAADDHRTIWAAPSTPGLANGRWALFWVDDDDNDLFTNVTNSVELLAASGATGTIGATLTKATASLTGAQVYTGTMASILTKATASLTGVMQPSGVIASTLQPALMNATGAQIYTGVIASLMQAALMNAAGTQSQSGSIAATLQAALFNATGHMAPSGVIAAQLQAALFNATGELPSEGTIAATLQSALFNATGVMMPSGAIAATLQAALFNAEGNLPVDGSLAATLTAALFNATGAMQPSGAIASILQPALFNASGSHTVNMTGTMAAALTMALFSGSGALTQTGAMIATLQTLLFNASGAQAAAAIALIVYLMGLDETAFKGQGLDELRRLATGLDLTGLIAAGYDESTLKRDGLDETVFAGRGLE